MVSIRKNSTLRYRKHYQEVKFGLSKYVIGFSWSGREHISSEKTATIWFRFVKILEQVIETISGKSFSVCPNMCLEFLPEVGNILISIVALTIKKTWPPWSTIQFQVVIGCLGHPRFWARFDATFSNNPHDISYWGHRHAVLTIFVRPFACPYGLESTISGKIVDSSPESGGSGHLRDTFFFLSE